MKKYLLVSFRYLLALVFIFSGFVKGIDPWGTAYKLTDYFVAFHLQFLNPLSLSLAVLLCSSELLIGLFLFFGTQVRLAIWGAFLFMLVFTPLTLILAISNPVSDCGCFGDAIKLSNWGTFYKNVLFFIAALYLFVNRKDFAPSHQVLREIALTLILAVLALAPSIHGIRHQPLLDFRPFHIGANLYESTRIPDDAPHDVYKTLLYYEKDGVKKEFDESNFPWNDSTWTFVDSKSVLVSKGYTPPISNFTVHAQNGSDYTDSILHSKGYLALVVIPNAKYLTQQSADEFRKVQKQAISKGIKIYGITSAAGTELAELESKHDFFFPLLQADEVILKTIVRSSPGLLLLYDGTIIGKWHWRDIPDDILANANPHSFILVQMWKSNEIKIAIIISLSLVFLLLLMNCLFRGR